MAVHNNVLLQIFSSILWTENSTSLFYKWGKWGLEAQEHHQHYKASELLEPEAASWFRLSALPSCLPTMLLRLETGGAGPESGPLTSCSLFKPQSHVNPITQSHSASDSYINLHSASQSYHVNGKCYHNRQEPGNVNLTNALSVNELDNLKHSRGSSPTSRDYRLLQRVTKWPPHQQGPEPSRRVTPPPTPTLQPDNLRKEPGKWSLWVILGEIPT